MRHPTSFHSVFLRLSLTSLGRKEFFVSGRIFAVHLGSEADIETVEMRNA